MFKPSPVLGAFVKLRKATGSFVMYVYPSARMEQVGFHGTDFQEILVFRYFTKLCQENSSFIEI
jgi:hypothetical protein